MLNMIIIFFSNLIVGGLIGLTGIAGFLLPMLYVFLGYQVQEALSLSFTAFLISGILGSITYYKNGQLNLSVGNRLGFFSLIGAIVGVYLNSYLSDDIIKVLLYLVVLFSGLSILFRKDHESENTVYPDWKTCFWLGIVTAAVCALSGAGGPILVMPLLVLMHVRIRESVALALYDSIFIAVPSIVGYFLQCDAFSLIPVLLVSAFAHGIGVCFGSVNAQKVDSKIIKKIVAIGSIIVALYKLFL